MRNDNNIKCNCIGGEEYKLTQYADETTFILDGTSQYIYEDSNEALVN